jgi:endonuclease/exonuclease/phosphatase family metal-dependent hydrolase
VIRVATWNVRHGRPRRGFASNRRLVSAAVGLGVDVLALQEVERRVVRSWFADQPARVAHALGAAHRFAPARRLALIGSDGVALCLRDTVLQCERVAIDRRVLLLARTPVASFACTHLQADAAVAKRQLERVIDTLTAWPAPRVLLGDLNLSTADVAGPLGAAGFSLVGGGPSEPAWAPVQRIDHVAVDGFATGPVSTPAVPVSDHRPVIVELDP